VEEASGARRTGLVRCFAVDVVVELLEEEEEEEEVEGGTCIVTLELVAAVGVLGLGWLLLCVVVGLVEAARLDTLSSLLLFCSMPLTFCCVCAYIWNGVNGCDQPTQIPRLQNR